MEEILEHINKKALKYFMFDWDDNILIMPTMIHLEHHVDGRWDKMDITTSEFAEVRSHLDQYYNKGNKDSKWRFHNNERSAAFCEFRDHGNRGKRAFLQDARKAIKYEKFGPVWDEFIQCLIGGHRFLIITARGHEPDTLKGAVNWIIHKVLTEEERLEMVNNLKYWTEMFNIDTDDWCDDDHIDYYLDLCLFIGIYSDWFAKNFESYGEVASPEKYKAMAIKYFVKKIHKFGKILNRQVKVGFSDDDLATVESIHKYFMDELSLDFPIEYYSWHTKVDGTKTKMD